tara:strand:+ start:13335 stop:22820 length:9486 start_codon:yes stop_codon:yes gene_type:complete
MAEFNIDNLNISLNKEEKNGWKPTKLTSNGEVDHEYYRALGTFSGFQVAPDLSSDERQNEYNSYLKWQEEINIAKQNPPKTPKQIRQEKKNKRKSNNTLEKNPIDVNPLKEEIRKQKELTAKESGSIFKTVELVDGDGNIVKDRTYAYSDLESANAKGELGDKKYKNVEEWVDDYNEKFKKTNYSFKIIESKPSENLLKEFEAVAVEMKDFSLVNNMLKTGRMNYLFTEKEKDAKNQLIKLLPPKIKVEETGIGNSLLITNTVNGEKIEVDTRFKSDQQEDIEQNAVKLAGFIAEQYEQNQSFYKSEKKQKEKLLKEYNKIYNEIKPTKEQINNIDKQVEKEWQFNWEGRVDWRPLGDVNYMQQAWIGLKGLEEKEHQELTATEKINLQNQYAKELYKNDLIQIILEENVDKHIHKDTFIDFIYREDRSKKRALLQSGSHIKLEDQLIEATKADYLYKAALRNQEQITQDIKDGYYIYQGTTWTTDELINEAERNDMSFQEFIQSREEIQKVSGDYEVYQAAENFFKEGSKEDYTIEEGKSYINYKGRKLPIEAYQTYLNIQNQFNLSAANITNSLINREEKYDDIENFNVAFEAYSRNFDRIEETGVRLGTAGLDLARNIVYGSSTLSSYINPLYWASRGIGYDPLKGVSAVNQSISNWTQKELQSYNFPDTQFGDINSLKSFLDWSLEMGSENLPQVAVAVFTGGIGNSVKASAWLSSSVLGASSAGQKFTEMDSLRLGGADISDAEYFLKGLGFGLTETIIGRFTMGSQIGQGWQILRAGEQGVVSELYRNGGRYMLNKGKKFFIDSNMEGMGESLVYTVQKAIDGDLENWKLIEAAESYSGGLLFDALAGPSIKTIGATGNIIKGKGLGNTYRGMLSRNFADEKTILDVEGLINKQKPLISQNTTIAEEIELLKQTDSPNFDRISELEQVMAINNEELNSLNTEVKDIIQNVENNVRKKGMKKIPAVMFTMNQQEMAELRVEGFEVLANTELSDQQKKNKIATLNEKYREIKSNNDRFLNSEVFGEEWFALKGNSVFNPDSKKEVQEIKNEAINIIQQNKNKPDYKPTNEEIDAVAVDIVNERRYDEQIVKLNKVLQNTEANGINVNTIQEAVNEINNIYDPLIEVETNENTKEQLVNRKNTLQQEVKSGKVNGFFDPYTKNLFNIKDVAIEQGKTATAVHEYAHYISTEMINKNPEQFESLSGAIIGYLNEYNPDVLLKMEQENVNLKVGNKYDIEELFSSFTEEIAEGNLDFEEAAGFLTVVGKAINKGLKETTNNEFDIDFKGENDIFTFLESFGNKFKQDVVDQQQMDALVKEAETLIKEPELEVLLSETPQKQRINEELVEIINNPESTRIERNRATEQLIADNQALIFQALGFDPKAGDIKAADLLDTVVKDQFMVKKMLEKYNPTKAKFSTYLYDILRRRRPEIYEMAGLDATKYKTESLDAPEARQLAEGGKDVIEKIDDKVKEKPARKKRSFTELGFKDADNNIIPTENLINEIETLLVDKIKRVVLMKDATADTILSEVENTIEKEISNKIKKAMGPITKSVIGFAPAKYRNFIENNMDILVGAMPINTIKQKAKSKEWARIFKLKEIGKEDIKKVKDGKTTYYRKQIFQVEKPNINDFKKYFTRAGYTTLIARQKSLTQPISKELAKIALLNITTNPIALEKISEKTGLKAEQVSIVALQNRLENISETLDNEASEIRSMDVIKFSKVLMSKDKVSIENFKEGVKSDEFKATLASNLANPDFITKTGETNAVAATIKMHFYPSEIYFNDISNAELSKIANEFYGPTQKKQVKAEAQKITEIELADIISDALINDVMLSTNYKAMELANGVNENKYNPRDLTSVNVGRKAFEKVLQVTGIEKFKRVFAPALAGPARLAGFEVKQPNSITLNEKDVIKKLDKGQHVRLSLFKNVQDLNDNLINATGPDGNKIAKNSTGDWGKVSKEGKMSKDITQKNWYFSKKWEGFSKTEKLDFAKNLYDEGQINKNIFRETVHELAKLSKEGRFSPEEARWFVQNQSADMTGGIKSSASLIGFPTLNKKQLQESLDLKDDDPYVLEHMTPAKRMSLLTYQYLLNPNEKTKKDFDKELDKFHTIILPYGVDKILRSEGKQASMGLKHKIGDDPFDTRYDEVLKIMEMTKIDGSIVGNTSVKYSKTNNSSNTQKFDAELINSSKVKKSDLNENTGISNNNASILDNALDIARDPNAPVKKIRVFDFDDTLARTKSNVLYTMLDGTTGKLTAEEFAKKGTEMGMEGAIFDFSEFNKVVDGKKGPLFDVAKKIQDARGTDDVFVLTARAPEAAFAIKEFLDGVGLNIPLENITGLGDSSPLAKSSWIVDKAADGYNDFYFADDHLGNVEAVKTVLDQIDVKSKVQQAKIKFSKTVDQAINDIIYEKTGIEPFKEYSDIRAQAKGREVKTFKLIPYSAEDFSGLLYSLLGKGKQGNAQWKWMQETLIDPYNRGVNDIAIAQNTMSADFKALKNSITGIPKNLKKKAFGGFTFEDVTRVTAWTKQGINIEGISKRDLNQIQDFVKENPELDAFAQQLIELTKGDGYHYPGKNWLAGTITTDFREGLRTTTRKKYLTEWNNNVDEAFSTKNLNKLEAVYGTKYREALEDSIERMKTGSNRNAKIGRLEARFLDYVNNSIGTVMFLNARSAVLQTISAVNFLNWSDNNPYKAAKAFANQPQYWSDFMTLMNSDYLVDRRNGLKINVSESEIAESAKTAKNKTKGVINTLLSKGFVLTQFADSFAIASGGATFYRNKLNNYLKDGLSQKDAEKQAFEDFRKTAEESQQSADPIRISQQQATTLGKVVLAFANTPSQYARIMKKAILDLANKRGDWKSNISKILYYGAIQNLMFTALQSAMFAVMFDDDEEKEEKGILDKNNIKTANSMLDNLLRGMGISGSVASTVKNVVIDLYDRSQKSRPEYEKTSFKLLDVSPPIDIKVSKFRQGMNVWEYNRKTPEAQDPFNVENPAYKAMAYVIASTTNIPLDRLYLKIENIAGALDANNEYWQRVAMALGWPKWQLLSEKERAQEKKDRKDRIKAFKKGRSYKFKPIDSLDLSPKVEKSKEKEIKVDTTTKYKPSTKTSKRKKILKDDRSKRQKRLYKLSKQNQIDTLKSLGVTPEIIKTLKYEEDRVRKIEKLYDENK